MRLQLSGPRVEDVGNARWIGKLELIAVAVRVNTNCARDDHRRNDDANAQEFLIVGAVHSSW